MTDDYQNNSNSITRVIFLCIKEIIDYLKKHDNFSLNSEIEKELENFKKQDTHLSIPTENIQKKKITENNELTKASASLKRPTLPRGNVNNTLCNYTKVQSNQRLKLNHKDWLDKIHEYNCQMKTAYDSNNINLIYQCCKLTVEKTCRLILDKKIFDKDQILIGAFLKTQQYYKLRRFNYPLILIESQENSYNSQEYTEFCNGYYLDRQEYTKNHNPFYLYLIFECIFHDFYDKRKDMRDYYFYFQKVNQIRNSSIESGHDLEQKTNSGTVDIKKLINFLEWFVNDIAYSCLNK